ncbi:MAG: hypothetical protein H6595_01660 [Flavobacteriales bacterium]|nr:hypothetical protein [Flavobacteriales bacterium]
MFANRHQRGTAVLLLALMMLVVAPRKLFHHCAPEHLVLSTPTTGAQINADDHCPICDAITPVFEGAVAWSAVPVIVPVVHLRTAPVTTVRTTVAFVPPLRGPPALV